MQQAPNEAGAKHNPECCDKALRFCALARSFTMPSELIVAIEFRTYGENVSVDMTLTPITEDYYMILGVEQTATPELIVSSYRRLALKLPCTYNHHLPSSFPWSTILKKIPCPRCF